MTCSACVLKIEKALEDKDIKAKVNLISEKLVVETEKYSETYIKEKLNNIGYDIQENDELEYKKVNLYLIGFLSIINMILAMNMNVNTGLIEFVITSIVMYLSRHIIIDGYKKIISLSFNMNSLITLGVISSYIYSAYNYINGHSHHLYFEGITMILFVVLIGKKIEANLKKNTNEAVEKIGALIPSYSYVLKDGKIEKVLTKDIKVKDIVVIKEGEIAPVDGVVISGNASFDENVITGESKYVEKNIGNEIIASSLLVSGQVNIEVTRVAEDTIISKIMNIVELSSDIKVDIARFADKVSFYFVPTVIIIAIITFLIWYVLTKNFAKAFNHFVVILVIACPCAVGLATPASITVAVGLLAKNNILIKNAKILEYVYKTTDIYMDKTGTLTEGKPRVIDAYIKDEDLNMLYNIEKYIEHPISKAIVDYANNKIKVKDIELNVRNYQGLGVSANEYIVGNINLMKRKKIDISKYEKEYDMLSNQGKTVIFVSKNMELVAILSLIDYIKESSYVYINKDRKTKINFSMLTGDNKNVAKYISSKLNISKYYAEVLPYEKSSYIEKTQSDKKIVAMVGDGVNDAPALACADIGIAVGSGTDIAIKSCDVILMKSDLNDIDKLMKISKYTMNNIKLNLFFSSIYNILGIVIATGIIGIELSPMLASVFMMLSSISVLLNSLSLKFKKIKE